MCFCLFIQMTFSVFLPIGSCADIIQAGFSNGLYDTAILYILKSVLFALEYLHKAGYIHRRVLLHQ